MVKFIIIGKKKLMENPNKIKKRPERQSPLQVMTEKNFHHNDTEALDDLNYKHDLYQSPDVYEDIAGNNNYDLLHDVLNYIIESDNSVDLLKKINTLSQIILGVLETINKPTQNEKILKMLLLRLQGQTLVQITNSIGITDSEQIKLFRKIDDVKILMVLKQATDINKHHGGNKRRNE